MIPSANFSADLAFWVSIPWLKDLPCVIMVSGTMAQTAIRTQV
jgi:hypothetical protein